MDWTGIHSTALTVAKDLQPYWVFVNLAIVIYIANQLRTIKKITKEVQKVTVLEAKQAAQELTKVAETTAKELVRVAKEAADNLVKVAAQTAKELAVKEKK